jgi:hypothetical protein
MDDVPADPGGAAAVVTKARFDFDDLMRQLMFVGFAALIAWSLTGVVGVISGSFGIEPTAALRFLLAILVVVFARRTYWEVREWRWRRTSPDDRFGFASPLWETPRMSREHPSPEAHIDASGEPTDPQ